MNAKRVASRRDWPRGLRMPRPGYYAYEDRKGKIWPIGSVPLAEAKAQAIQANAYEADKAPTLVERMQGTTHTVSDLLQRMPVAETANTRASHASQDKRIKAALGNVPLRDLTPPMCAALVESVTAQGHARMAQSVRSRLVSMCRRGVVLGWLASNPAEPVPTPRVTVQRMRLTLEMWRQIRAHADAVAPWAGHAMDLALVTAADVSTLAGLRRDDVQGDALMIRRGKTGAYIAVPLALEVAGLTLRDLVRRSLAAYILHWPEDTERKKAGDPVHKSALSRAFLDARRLAGIPDQISGKAAPTMHECRSLAIRLVTEKYGREAAQALAGHTDAAMTDVYRDSRGMEPVRVKIKM